MSLVSDLSSLKKRLKKTALDLVPDPLEDATRYLTRYGGAALGAGRDVLTGPRSEVPDIVDVYDFLARKSDPLRETAFTIGENITRPTDILSELGKERSQPGGLGAAFRSRANTPVKRGLESLVDPMVAAPVGFAGNVTGGVGKALGQMALRDVALPAIGQIAGGELGQRLGGDTGGGIGELAGALLGGGLPDPRQGERARNLLTEGFGAAAGAIGGFQASEDQDPYTRAFATLGGAVVGGVLGRRVSRGEPIGLAIEDVGGRIRGIVSPDAGGSTQQTGQTIRQKLDAVKKAVADAGPTGDAAFDAIPFEAKQALKSRSRWNALSRILNDIAAPARNRPEAHPAIGGAGGLLGEINEGRYAALDQADILGDAAKAIDAAGAIGGIVPKPEYLDRVAQAKRQALVWAEELQKQATKAAADGQDKLATRLKRRALHARHAPNLIEELKFSGPAIIEHPDEFTFADAGAESAFRQIRAAYDELKNREELAGITYNLRENYINRAWDLGDEAASALRGGRRLDARQPFQQASSLTDFLDGLSQGFLPKSMDTKSLYQARAEASAVAIAQHNFLQNEIKPRIKKATDAAVQNNPGDWKHLDEGFLKRVFPTIDTASINRMLGDIEAEVKEAGELSAAGARAARGTIREATGVGFQNFFLPKEWADELQAQLGPATIEDVDWLKPVGFLNNQLRRAKLGFDLAQFFRVGPAAMAQVWAMDPFRPDRAIDAGGNILKAMIKGRGWLDQQDATRRAVRYLPGFGAPGERGEVLDIPKRAVPGDIKVPVVEHGLRAVGKGYNWLEDQQFNKLIPATEVFVFDALFDILKDTRVGREIGEDALRRHIGSSVSARFGGFGRQMAGVSANRAWGERVAVLSPSWFRGLAKTAVDPFKPGVEGDIARRFWGGVGVLGVATGVMGTMALKGATGGYGDPSAPDTEEMWKDFKELLLDPKSERNVWNPDSANFLSIELPGGEGRIDFWGSYRPLLRAMVAPVTGGVKGMADAQGAFQDGVGWAAAAGFLGDIAREMKDEQGKWLNGRLALIPRATIDAFINEDFYGRDIRTARDAKMRALQQAVYTGASMVPGVFDFAIPIAFQAVGVDADIQNVVGEHARATPEGVSNPWANVVKSLTGATGLNLRLASQDPGAVKQSIRDLATSKGKHAGQDPVAWYRTPGNGLDAAEKRAFETQNPHVRTYIETKRLDAGAREDKPFGREAQTFFQTARTKEVQKLDQKKKDLGEQYRAGGISGDMYRERRNQAEAEYSIAVQTYAQHYFGTSDLDEVYTKMPASKEPFDAFLDEYYSIRPQGSDRASLDAFFAARAEKLQTLSPEEQRKFFDYQIAKGVDETERQYIKDSQLMAERMRIPQYAGLSLDDGRAIQRASQRISDLQRVHPGLNRRMALMLDTESSALTKFRLMQVWSRRIAPNPVVKGYEMSHPTLVRFFSTLSADAFADTTAS